MTTIQIPLAEYEKLKADAERYAEARRTGVIKRWVDNEGKVHSLPVYNEHADAAIDDAIKQEGGA